MWQHNNNNNNKGDNEKLGKRRYITANELVSGSRVIKKIKRDKAKQQPKKKKRMIKKTGKTGTK